METLTRQKEAYHSRSSLNNPSMKIEHLSVSYDDTLILKNINVDIPQGDFIFLIGGSGSGKTSFIRTIIGELPPKKWSIYNNSGHDIYTLGKNELLKYRRTLGVIFQDFKLLPKKTIAENVQFAMEVCGYTDDAIKMRVPEVLREVWLYEKRNAFIETLSGWEIQRTSIARALIHNPDIIIGDEPTGNLDPKNAEEVIKLLQKLHKEGKTIIIATHDDRLVDTLKKRVIAFRDQTIISDTREGTYCL